MHTIRGPWWPLDPRPEELHIEVIARGCATECRFNGQAGWYSVAQHCVLASEITPPEWALWALLHDAPEGLGLKDLPRPVKRHIGRAYHMAESRIMEVVCQKWDLDYELRDGMVRMPEAVQLADEIMLATEARDLIGVDAIERWSSIQHVTPLAEGIRPWGYEQAEEEFLARFRELTR